jgi:hypothetical protein
MVRACAPVCACQRRRALQGRRRDMASHGKEAQRRAAANPAGMVELVRRNAL